MVLTAGVSVRKGARRNGIADEETEARTAHGTTRAQQDGQSAQGCTEPDPGAQQRERYSHSNNYVPFAQYTANRIFHTYIYLQCLVILTMSGL